MKTNLPGELDGAIPAGVRLDTLRGAPRQMGEATVTPVARRLTLRWPGGAWAYAWPIAIDIQTARGTRRARIIPVQRIAVAALAGFALAALAGVVAQWWLNQRLETQEGTRGSERHGNNE